ncbi:urease accessory protein UreD [uncultured Sulfitobacter sp.]|uniref:urease accessory protein UreD n=1 Tax=uncultured Sulfitobacter sp. TaxID=191468 RepID=UPI00260DA803|nr:urease accessory protein UreD [uncultured Sulfitobacter sp.]
MSLDTLQIHSDRDAVAPRHIPRAQGAIDVSVHCRDGATRLSALRQSGCMKCVFPTIFRPDAEAVLVNTSGGVTGGDRISVSGAIGEDSTLTLTTQAAERIYRTTDGTTGGVQTRLCVAPGGRLNWLPQETIVFDRARLRRDLRIDLAKGATALLCETLVFGRAAMGETLQDVSLHDSIKITRCGLPLFLDAVRLNGAVAQHMDRAAIGNGAGVVATAVLVSPQAGLLLPKVRALLPATGGASLRNEDVLVVRALAEDSLALRRFMIPVLEHLAGQPLPAVWRL